MEVPIAAAVAAFLIVILLVIVYLSIRVVQQYEKMVVFRLGKTNEAMVREILRHNPPLEITDSDYHLTPLGWTLFGSENGWYCRTGNYSAAAEALIQAGAKLPGKLEGTEAVRDVLRRYEAKE